MKKGKGGKGGHDKKDHGGGGGGKKPLSYTTAADAAYHTMDCKKTKKIFIFIINFYFFYII